MAVPVLDEYSNETIDIETGKPFLKSTKADRELKDFDRYITIKIKHPISNKVVYFPVWRFIERYIRIKNDRGDIIPLELNDQQIDVYKTLCLLKKAGKLMRLNILKARQLGMSTFIAALYTVMTLLVPNQNAVIVANTANNASGIFEIYKSMYDWLPEWIKKQIPKIASNAKEVAVSHGLGKKSSIRILVANDDSGRGTTCQFLHLSEVAFWDDIDSVIRALMQTVHITNPNTIVIYETTANGINSYKELYDRSLSGKSPFKALFYPWYSGSDYRAPYYGFELLPHEEKLVNELHLSLEQIAWYRIKFEEMNDINSLRQEYPSTVTEAFITSGHSYFPSELTSKRKSELLGKEFPQYSFIWDEKIVSSQGDSIFLKNWRLTPTRNGAITIFKDVIAGHPYIVNADPNMGGEDYYVAHVFDNATFEQVAIFALNKNSDYEWINMQIVCLAKYYNDALLNAECNNSTGTYLLKYAQMMGHNFIYQDSSVETLGTRYEDKYGYKTKTTNREYMLNLLNAAFRDKYQFVNDFDTLCEMENFQVVKNDTTKKEKAQATGGAHDDRVTALFGIFLARSKMIQTTLIDQEAAPKKLSTDELEERLWEKEMASQEVNRKVFQIWD